MTGEESCPGGGIDCDYSETHELTLVEKILRTIEQYNKEVKANPCPSCLRDAMLAVAALLHLQSVRMEGGVLIAATNNLEAEFADAALDRLQAVTGTVSGQFTSRRQ